MLTQHTGIQQSYSPFLSVQVQAVSLLEIKLEQLKQKQLKQVVALDRLCLGGLWSLEGYQKELDSPNSTLLVLSIKSTNGLDPDIIGFGCFWAILEEAHLTILAIHPDYQKQGLGQLLLYALLRDAFKRGLQRATLEVRESNRSALSLYQKFGFKIAGRRKGYYQKWGEDALILWHADLGKPEFESFLAGWQQQVEERVSQNNWTIGA